MPTTPKVPKLKNKKRPLLVPGEENVLTGKQLHNMGRYVTTDSRLIAATCKYSVFVLPGSWVIRFKSKK
jgi:hypothetical protein